MYRILIFLTFLISVQTNAQVNRTQIQGKVHSNNLVLENVNVVNKSSRKGTVTDQQGNFKLFAKKNDTIQFSNIQYQTKIIILKDKHLINTLLNINLIEKTNELQEVVIQNMAKKLGLPNASKKPLEPTERKLNYINKGGNIDKVYAWVTGNRKRLEILQQRLDEDKKQLDNTVNIQLIRNHFTDDFFINTIKISKENIDNLIRYCLSKGIVFAFEKERYLEVVDILIRNKKAFLISKENRDMH